MENTVVRYQSRDGIRHISGNILHIYHMLWYPKLYLSDREFVSFNLFFKKSASIRLRRKLELCESQGKWPDKANKDSDIIWGNGIYALCIKWINPGCSMKVMNTFSARYTFFNDTNMAEYIKYPRLQYLIMRMHILCHEGVCINEITDSSYSIDLNFQRFQFLKNASNKKHAFNYLMRYVNRHQKDIEWIIRHASIPTNILYYWVRLAIHKCNFKIYTWAYYVYQYAMPFIFKNLSANRLDMLLRRNVITRQDICEIRDILHGHHDVFSHSPRKTYLIDIEQLLRYTPEPITRCELTRCELTRCF